MRRSRVTAAVAAFAVVALAACNGKAVLIEERSGEMEAASGTSTGKLRGSDRADLLAKGGSDLKLGEGGGGPGSVVGSDPRCATNSDPDEGFTAETLKIGTIIPLTGALRPLGEQTARVMRVTVEQTMNRQDRIGGAYSGLVWGCSERPGIFGRRVELKIFSMQNNTPEEALAGMRRLIDVENVFLVRDCYLESNLVGPATQYQNQKGVPGIWCYYSEMPLPALATWNFSPGTDPQVAAAINAGYAFKKMNKQRAAIIADPTQKDILVPVIKRVAAHFDHPIPDDCIVYKKSQEASNGMRSEVTRIRTCYGAGQTPDMVVALDALNGIFAALEAESQGWRGAANDVHWTCTGLSCWITSLADLCGNACEGMTTNCASLPCIPWASQEEFPAAERLERTRRLYLSREPQDILTYGPAAITGGIALWLTMTGPDLSREKFAHTIENLRNWNSGIGPILNTHEGDHFGGKSTWVIKFTGRSPWFDDVTGGFLTLDDVGVPESVVRGG
jgi:hypothetical protein